MEGKKQVCSVWEHIDAVQWKSQWKLGFRPQKTDWHGRKKRNNSQICKWYFKPVKLNRISQIENLGWEWKNTDGSMKDNDPHRHID